MATAPPPEGLSEAANHAPAPTSVSRLCTVRRLGVLGYQQAWQRQLELVAQVKSGSAGDQLLFVEHPPTITLGRNSDQSNILAPSARLAELGVALEETDRGGDVTFHGPGQIVGYPILDLKQWKRDVGAYLRALEDVIIAALADCGIAAGRVEGCTGVWADGAKIAAMGIHLSRWVTSHGFAINVTNDMDYFGLIIPCGLTKPVTSVEQILGHPVASEKVTESVIYHFGRVFQREMAADR